MNENALELEASLSTAFRGNGRVTVLTGAGVSAESGIPTFRGPEGYWTIGSRNYQPHEISTYAMFRRNPAEVWKWFLFRRGVCMASDPNSGHFSLVEMEQLLGKRFTLITQNIDGLHLRAGNTHGNTYQVHGNLNYMRCTEGCNNTVYPIPDEMPAKLRGEGLSKAEWTLLACPSCGAMTRPHVLLWDECYNEEWYRFTSSLRVAEETALLIVVGTTGATNLPNLAVEAVVRAGGTVIDINPQRNRFSEVALKSPGGLFLQTVSSQALPRMATVFKALAGDSPETPRR